jgi:hypothetical protein
MRREFNGQTGPPQRGTEMRCSRPLEVRFWSLTQLVRDCSELQQSARDAGGLKKIMGSSRLQRTAEKSGGCVKTRHFGICTGRGSQKALRDRLSWESIFLSDSYRKCILRFSRLIEFSHSLSAKLPLVRSAAKDRFPALLPKCTCLCIGQFGLEP